MILRCLFFRYGKNGDRKNLLSNFIFDVSLGNERQASSENTVTWEGNQPRSRTVKRSSTDLTELIKKLRSVNWINPINYCVTKRRNLSAELELA